MKGVSALPGAAIIWLGLSALSGLAGEPLGYFVRGLTVQMTNPKAALTWIAIMSLGLHDRAPLWVALSIVIGTTALSLVGYHLYAVAFSTTTMARVYSKGRRWIQGALGVFFALAGIRLLTSRL